MGGGDAGEQFALLRIARLYGKIAPQVGEDSVFGIKPELGLALLLVRPMAMEAILGKDGTDVPVEGEPFAPCPYRSEQRPKAECQKGMEKIFFQGGERVGRILIS